MGEVDDSDVGRIEACSGRVGGGISWLVGFGFKVVVITVEEELIGTLEDEASVVRRWLKLSSSSLKAKSKMIDCFG